MLKRRTCRKLLRRYMCACSLMGCNVMARWTSRDFNGPVNAVRPLELWWKMFCICWKDIRKVSQANCKKAGVTGYVVGLTVAAGQGAQELKGPVTWRFTDNPHKVTRGPVRSSNFLLVFGRVGNTQFPWQVFDYWWATWAKVLRPGNDCITYTKFLMQNASIYTLRLSFPSCPTCFIQSNAEVLKLDSVLVVLGAEDIEHSINTS